MNDSLYPLHLVLQSAKTDKELFDAASAIVLIPKKPGDDPNDGSFILHAPLELCARYFLLPLVDDTNAIAARDQIRNLAKKCWGLNDADSNYLPAKQEIGFDVTKLNVDELATTLLFASHATILLAMQINLQTTNSSIHRKLFQMASAISIDKDSRMAWSKVDTTINEPTARNLQDFYIENIANIERGNDATDTIRGLVEAVENSGLLAPTLNSLTENNIDEQYKMLMRISTLSMIIESEEHSKYGWSHALTIPHSIWSLNSFRDDSLTLLKAAITHCASYRHSKAEQKISAELLNDYYDEDELSIFTEHYVLIVDIISKACSMEDAHLVKYSYTCLDLMKKDPQFSRLYATAADRLLHIWLADD